MKNSDTMTMWEAIKKMGKFSDSDYDKSIEKDMRRELGLPVGQDLEEAEPELVLSAFFKVMSPLSVMYEDILCLFGRCRADSSKENIEIEFQSEKNSWSRLNLQNFIKAKEVLTQIKAQQKRVELNEEGIHKLWRLSTDNLRDRKKIGNVLFQKWSDEYSQNMGGWPQTKLDYDFIVKDLPIKDELRKGYAFWEELFRFYQETGIGRENWHWSIESSGFEPELLYPETDYCLQAILYNLYFVAENYGTFSENQKKLVQEQLDRFLLVFHENTENVDKNVRLWKEFLKLPVWKKRYEVYSIWVFADIVSAFTDKEISFHVENGKLVFPFSGACLAELRLNQKKFDLWTELRTPTITKPIGKSRVAAIQPDYSIVCGDPNRILDTVIVIECKQYKKANAKNFQEAIFDYAVNRPNAKVLLADYGEINLSEKSLSLLSESVPRNRYQMFSQCRPGCKSRDTILEEVCKELYERANVFKVPNQCSMAFTLVWGDNDMTLSMDLDLHLNFAGSQGGRGPQTLSYNTDEIEGARYSGDMQSSPGMECISIEAWQTGVYDLWVHNYSMNHCFEDAKPILFIKSDAFTQVIELETARESGEGRYGWDELPWWHILTIDMELQRGYVINKRKDHKQASTS